MIPDIYTLAGRALMRLTQDGECWTWSGANDGHGYGAMGSTNGRGGTQKYRVHRVVYEALVGEIPAGHDLDHLCRNRACANPSHLEPVTRRENLLRGETLPARYIARTKCANGHPYDQTNTAYENGARRCRRCRADRERARRARLREAA